MLRIVWRVFKTVALAVLAAFTLFVVYEVFTFPRVSDLQTKNPETTSMIETRLKEARDEGREPRRVQQWVPLARISPNLWRAVLAGEDTNFVTHHGFDYEAIQKAWDAGQKESEKEAKQEGDEDPSDWIPDLSRFKRGGSTISQQLAKNLYLSSERSAARKVKEAAITYFLERSLSKCHTRNLPQRHRVGRRHLRRRGRGPDLLPQARLGAHAAGGRLPLGDDPLPAQRLQPAEE